MGAAVIGVAVTIVAGLLAFFAWSSAGGRGSKIDVGSVSEGWLSEQRAGKDS